MGKDLLKGREPQLWFEERMHGYKVKKDQSIYEKTKCPTEKKKIVEQSKVRWLSSLENKVFPWK